MKEKKRMRRHRFLEKMPVTASVLTALLGLIPTSVIVYLAQMLAPAYVAAGTLVGLLLGVLLTAALYRLWFRPEFEGLLRGGKLGRGFLLGLFIAVYWALGMVLPILFTDRETSSKLTAEVIANASQAGFLEELCFRGLLLGSLLRVWKVDKRFLPAALVAGLVFGLAHGFNVLSGADPVQTVLQVLQTIVVGIFFSAVYIRCGNLWPLIFYHTLHDILAISLSPEVNVNGVITGVVTWLNYADLGASLILGVVGIWLLRREKTEEIRALWDQKWKKPSLSAEPEL